MDDRLYFEDTKTQYEELSNKGLIVIIKGVFLRIRQKVYPGSSGNMIRRSVQDYIDL